MATVNLGRLKPVFKGAYNSSTAYVIDDIVTYANETYINIQAGTNQQPNTATGYWTKLAAKGTDGTDVGTTLTTQGDILYRDGSGLQRLAKGTASQVLKMNTAANAPEWGNLSSDFVKINSGTFSSVSVVDIDGTTNWGSSSDYAYHKLVFTEWSQSETANLKGRQLDSGSQNTADIYGSQIDYGYSGNDTAYSKGIESDEWQFTQDNLRGTNNSAVKHKLEFNIWGLYGSHDDDVCKIRSDVAGQNQDGGTPSRRVLGFHGANITRNAWGGNQTRTGLRFYPNTGNVSGAWITYGIKG